MERAATNTRAGTRPPASSGSNLWEVPSCKSQLPLLPAHRSQQSVYSTGGQPSLLIQQSRILMEQEFGQRHIGNAWIFWKSLTPRWDQICVLECEKRWAHQKTHKILSLFLREGNHSQQEGRRLISHEDKVLCVTWSVHNCCINFQFSTALGEQIVRPLWVSLRTRYLFMTKEVPSHVWSQWGITNARFFKPIV